MSTTTLECRLCGGPMAGRRSDARWCSATCRAKARFDGKPPCTIEGCTRPTKSRGLCNTHAERLRVTGTVEERPNPRRRPDGHVSSVNGYLVVRATDHPVADRRGDAYLHRVVLFDLIGGGEHPCHWCDTPVAWGFGLQVDHLDWNHLNNAPANLVASCGPCNNRRQPPRKSAHATQA